MISQGWGPTTSKYFLGFLGLEDWSVSGLSRSCSYSLLRCMVSSVWSLKSQWNWELPVSSDWRKANATHRWSKKTKNSNPGHCRQSHFEPWENFETSTLDIFWHIREWRWLVSVSMNLRVVSYAWSTWLSPVIKYLALQVPLVRLLRLPMILYLMLELYSLDEWVTRGLENWLDNQGWGLMCNPSPRSW